MRWHRKSIEIEAVPESDFSIKQIPLYSEKAKATGEITAKALLPPDGDITRIFPFLTITLT